MGKYIVREGVDVMETKKCTCCGRELPLSEFYKNKRNKDGYATQCKECMNTNKIKYNHICKFCGKEFSNAHKKSKYCSNKCSSKGRAKSHEKFIDELFNINPNIEILSEYKGEKQLIKCRCKIHNITYESSPQVLLRGTGCHKCTSEKISNKKIKSHENFILEMKTIHPNIKVLDEYKGNDKPIKCKCEICGCEFNSRPHDLLKGHGCRDCGIKRRSGENHPRYNPNLTDEDRGKTTSTLEYRLWRKQIFERDNYTCQCCGDNKGGNLNAHHKNARNLFPNEKFILFNPLILKL